MNHAEKLLKQGKFTCTEKIFWLMNLIISAKNIWNKNCSIRFFFRLIWNKYIFFIKSLISIMSHEFWVFQTFFNFFVCRGIICRRNSGLINLSTVYSGVEYHIWESIQGVGWGWVEVALSARARPCVLTKSRITGATNGYLHGLYYAFVVVTMYAATCLQCLLRIYT